MREGWNPGTKRVARDVRKPNYTCLRLSCTRTERRDWYRRLVNMNARPRSEHGRKVWCTKQVLVPRTIRRTSLACPLELCRHRQPRTVLNQSKG